MRRRIVSIGMILCMLLMMGCATHIHTIGSGPPARSVTEEARQWWVLFGLVPINEVDTRAMAGDAENYEITTELTFLDVVINMFTSIASVTSRTVTVEKLAY